MSGGVAGLVLAAGESRRMPGHTKQLLPYRGTTLVRSVVDAGFRAGLEPLLVVIGHEAEAVAADLAGTGARTILNPAYDKGIRESLARGLEAFAGVDCEAVVVLLADEPDVEPVWVRRVIDRWHAGGVDAVRIQFADRPGHPVLLSRSAIRSMPAGHGSTVWQGLVRSGARVVEVDVDQAAPIDIDEPADYEAAIAASGGNA